MLFLQNFFPLVIYHSSKLGLFRIQAPLADQDTIQFPSTDFLDPSFVPITTLYALNPRIFPPLPLGTALFLVHQRPDGYRETLTVKWVEFPIMTNVDYTNGDFCFIAFVSCPSAKESIPLFIRNEYENCQLTMNKKDFNQYFSFTPVYHRVLDRDNFLLFLYDAPRLYWRGTTTGTCVPSSNPQDFSTLDECQRVVYPKIRIHKSFTGNAAIALSRVRDKLFPDLVVPSFPSANLVLTLLLLALLIVVVAFLFFFSWNHNVAEARRN
jgi:hypothetical protein